MDPKLYKEFTLHEINQELYTAEAALNDNAKNFPSMTGRRVAPQEAIDAMLEELRNRGIELQQN